MTNNLPKPVQAYAAVSPDGRTLYTSTCADEEHQTRCDADFLSTRAGGYAVIPVTIIPTEQYEAMVALCAAADAVLEETAGRKALSSGPCGMTIEAQLRASHYRISAWAVEEIREATAALAALKEQKP